MTPQQLPLDAVSLTGGVFENRRAVNRRYLASLSTTALLQNHMLEAGVGSQEWHLSPSTADIARIVRERHWGWETPGGRLRGHFVGHWMSAAAREIAVTGDAHLRAAVDDVLDGLEACQREGDGEWVYAIPRSYLDRLATGLDVWAPQYAIHKTIMGLVDVYRDLGDERALVIARRGAQPLLRWARGFTDDEFQRIIEVETGGMLEAWADLLAATGDDIYHELLDRYYHRSLFDGMLEGRDMLTNMHANTTIPEALGAARAYEVTGDEKWRRIVEAYWRCAVTDRGTFCTGGQTSGEIWTPPFEFAARRGEKTQELCTVYNMIRLADVLYRWTGETRFLDYIELNLVNGILAQQHPRTGMPAYFLPLEGGAIKNWGTPTEDFWCCHGTLVQAHTRHASLTFYREGPAVVVAQYASARARLDDGSIAVETVDNSQEFGPAANAGAAGDTRRPHALRVRVTIESSSSEVRLRIPSWATGAPQVTTTAPTRIDGDWLVVDHPGGVSVVEAAFPFALRALPIPDDPTTIAFAEGPTVLAGIVDHEMALVGDPTDPESLLTADNERQWGQWLVRYRTVGQRRAIRFVPLHEITDERFSVYFPVHAFAGGAA